MSDNFREFDLALKQFSKKTVPEAVGHFRDAVALEAVTGVVQLTPVDTGRARGNWQVNANAPAEGHNPDASDKNGAATISAGEAAIRGIADPFAPVWLHNGVPYIEYINDGTEKVPAVHMVERTVGRLRRAYG